MGVIQGIGLLLVGLVTGLLASSVYAADAPIRIEQGWVRALPAVSRVGSAYFVIHNDAEHSDRLLSVRSPVAGRVEVHQSREQNGMAMMVPVDALAVPAHGQVSLQSGGYHLMLMQLQQHPAAGEKVAMQLQFERAGQVQVELPVLKRGPQSLDAHRHHAEGAMADAHDAHMSH